MGTGTRYAKMAGLKLLSCRCGAPTAVWLKHAALSIVASGALLSAQARDIKLPSRLHFSADIAIDASGTAMVSNLKGAEGALANALRTHVQALRFEPARLKGVAVESTTYLTAEAIMTEGEDGRVDVQVDGIRTGPMPRKVSPPKYPAEMARHGVAGSAMVMFKVSANGTPADVQFINVTDDRIVASLEEVVKRWRFGGETIAGSASREVAAIPVWFYPRGKRSELEKPVFSCPVADGRPHVAGSIDGCVGMIEATSFPP